MKNPSDISKINENDIDSLVELDSNGFLLAPNESLDKYKKRILIVTENVENINNELRNSQNFDFNGICVLNERDRIPAEIMSEASRITKDEYGFEIDWAPGFFMSKSLGLLWGGCAILIPEVFVSVFLIRSSFREKRKWLFYRRDELLSHELCHTARMPIDDRVFDENFAYKLSPSWLRRKFGSCFRHEADAILFILPIFLLLAVQMLGIFFAINIPILPFWILALIYPIFLLIRNHLTSSTLKEAAKALSLFGFEHPYSALFRSTSHEIVKIAKFANSQEELSAWLAEKEKSEIRWKLIIHRFGPK